MEKEEIERDTEETTEAPLTPAESDAEIIETAEITEAPVVETEEGNESLGSSSESSSPSKRAKKAPAKKRIIKKQKEIAPKEPKPQEPNPEPAPCTTCAAPWKASGKYFNILLVIVGLLLLYNIVTLWQTGNSVNTKLAALEEAAVPLNIQVIIITAAGCGDCYEIHNVVPALKKFNVNITEQREFQSDSVDAQALMQKYSLQKVPAIIVTTTAAGAAEKADVMAQLEKIFTKVSDTELVYENPTPPYLDLVSGEVKGHVTVISLTAPDCEDCQNISSIIPALKKVLTIIEIKEVAYDTAAGQQYLNRYGLEFAPTIILSSDAAAYEGFTATWKKYGTEEKDGSFVFRNTIPPYLNTTTSEVEGLVHIIYLTDESCTDCYNATMHKQILEGFGMKFGTETTVDISSQEGKALLEKYSITKVPTIILSSDAAAYPALGQVWTSVGEIADDGSYIFTAMNQLQGAKYTDLSAAAADAATTTDATSTSGTAEADGTA